MQRMRETFILCLSLILTALMCSCEEDSTIDNSDPDEVEESQGIFVPTREWQEIKEGQSIPAGLHVRISLQTGQKEAKLLEEDDSDKESSGHHVSLGGVKTDAEHQAYGESDRRGIVNKRTKVFSVDEVREMLQDLNSISDQENIPRIAAGRPLPGRPSSNREHIVREEKDRTEEGHFEDMNDHLMIKSIKDLPLSFHRDVEVMIELSKLLADNSSGVSDLCHALKELEYYVHQIDNAKDLNVIGGLVLVVRLLNHTHPEVRSWAAHVIGSASQSNPSVQEQALEYGSLLLLSELLSSSEPELVQRRALFALNALLRGHPPEQVNFIKVHHGLSILGRSFEERSPQVQLKAVVLLTDLLSNKFSDTENDGHHLELLVLIYDEVLISGWCKNIPLLIYSDQLVRVEKGLIAMEALIRTCGFTAEMPRLKKLKKWLEKDTDGDMEYASQLLGHCNSLLRSIRQYNLDL